MKHRSEVTTSSAEVKLDWTDSAIGSPKIHARIELDSA
jgi:hypothetical protein